MTTTTEEERALELAHQAVKSIKTGNLLDAARFLREATTIAPEHPEVKAGWVKLKEKEDESPLLELCREWVKSRDEADGDKALKILKSQALSQENGKAAFEILLDFKGEDDLLDEATGLLLANPGAQSLLVKEIEEHPTKTYYELFERGDDSIAGLLKVQLNRSIWPSEEIWQEAYRNIFMLSLAMTMEEALDYPSRAMKGVANLLAANASQLKGIIDADSFDVILESLDMRLHNELRSHATLATVKLLELAPNTAQDLVSKFVIGRVQKGTADGLIVAFSAAAAIFPITVSVAATLFLTDGFITTLVPLVQSKQSTKLEQAALELLNAACVDKNCRAAINRHCRDWLEDVIGTATDKHRANLAAVVLVKLDQEGQDATQASTGPQVVVSGVDPDDLVHRFKNMVLSPEKGSKKDSIEGLAFASLRPQVQEDLAHDTPFLKALINAMKEPDSPQILFGGLSVFVNLTTYLPIQSEEEKRMAQLKAYANTQKPAPPDPLQDEAHTTARCKKVLDSGIVPLLVSTSKKASPGVLTSTLQIILSLSRGKTHRGTLAQQGAIKLLLQIYELISNPSSTTSQTFPNAEQAKATAAQALAKILITTNPTHIFSSALPSSSAIRPLLSLLKRPEEAASTWQLYAFESLLALTNLASMDQGTQNAIVRSAFDIINDDLLLSPNVLVRRATSELVCNLMAAPECLAKFADPADTRAPQRLHILLAISDVDDLPTRSAAGGALAMLLSYDEGVVAVLKQDRGVEFLLGLCRDEDEDVKYRGIVCLRSVLGATGDIGKQGLEALQKKGAVDALKAALKEIRRQDVLGLGVETLKILLGQS